MITLDPETVGTLAPPSKLTYSNAVDGTSKGKPSINCQGKCSYATILLLSAYPGTATSTVPFRALPRLERLRAQGKADDSEIPADEDEDMDDGDAEKEGLRPKKVEKEKMKMRGKSKTLKRYLRKKRKNVIDATTVSYVSHLDHIMS
jgi:U3 small nucleolar RNA-associated protein 7